jgi:hypothetical protein
MRFLILRVWFKVEMLNFDINFFHFFLRGFNLLHSHETTVNCPLIARCVERRRKLRRRAAALFVERAGE